MTAVVGFFDVTCEACHCRFGWSGSIESRPDCPRCGFPGNREQHSKDVEAVTRHLERTPETCGHLRPARSLTGDRVCQDCGAVLEGGGG